MVGIDGYFHFALEPVARLSYSVEELSIANACSQTAQLPEVSTYIATEEVGR